MRRITLVALLAILASPALGQGYDGNWACRSGEFKAGIFTVMGPNYGFASAVAGDPASGTGTVMGYSDGVAITDGNLKSALQIEAARLVTDAMSGVALQLESASAVIMHCTPRN